jgi:hypothetical protein
MQTFQVTLKLDIRAVVPERFLQEARAEAVAEGASAFLKRVQELYPEDDDQFMLAILKNAIRSQVRHNLVDFLQRSGVGGSVSPVQVIEELIMQPRSAVSDFANGGDAVQEPSEGGAVQALIESRKE